MNSAEKNYDRNVFINCPFDTAYAPLFQAIIFATVDCGFSPRTALDVSDTSEIRIQKIYQIIGTSRLGIHDLSRTQLDDATGLPRFNMPLELGIFLGAKFLGDATQRQKACLVFDEQPYRYRTYLSDVAGQDIAWHKNDPKLVIFGIRDWLAHLSEKPLPSGSLIYDHFTTFKGELRYSCEILKQRPDELTYRDFLHHVQTFNKGYVEILIVGGKRVKSPAKIDIKNAVRNLKNKDEPFVILGKGATELSYIQAYRTDEAGLWFLEYQDGHLDEHYRSLDFFASEAIIRIFQQYLDGNEEWRTAQKWERMDLP